MMRAFILASAGIALFGACAQADNFDFTFTGSLGTVTGEIIGLTNNTADQKATEVEIFTEPAGLDFPSGTLTPTSWTDPDDNSFTEEGGVITASNFSAEEGTGCPFHCASSFQLSTGGFFSSASLENGYADDSLPYFGTIKFTAVTTTSAVPEPTSVVLLSTLLLLAVALVVRKRLAHGV
jgi:hypothetical protein